MEPEQVFRSEITTAVLIPFAPLRHFAALRERALTHRSINRWPLRGPDRANPAFYRPVTAPRCIPNMKVLCADLDLLATPLYNAAHHTGS